MKVELISYTPDPVELCGKIAGLPTGKGEHDNFVEELIKMSYLDLEILEHVVFTFRVESVSSVLTHQMRSFLRVNQERINGSRTNSITPPFNYLTEENKRQALLWFDNAMLECKNNYDLLISIGVKPEDAKYVLPNATKTKLYWTVNARALRRFFKLRLHKDAQWEIGEMAQKMFDLVYPEISQIELIPQSIHRISNLRVEKQTLINMKPFFEDLEHLRKTGEYSGEEGRSE